MYLLSHWRFFYVSEDFKFPSNVDLLTSLRFWFNGLTVGDNGDFVKPFRQLTLKGLHTKTLKNTFKLTWKKFFKILDIIEGVNMLPAGGRGVTKGDLALTYDELLKILRTYYSYCFT